VALIGAAADSQFQVALSSRDLIGQAKGILMHREKLSGARAFQLLVKTSQHANIRLTDLAGWIVDEHESGLGAAECG
jgi:AmiR/NasT family two-component response regulator